MYDISKNEKVEKLYDIWYRAKCSVYNTYTDNVPEKLPLSQEKAFKAIRNALIYEANSLNYGSGSVNFGSYQTPHTSRSKSGANNNGSNNNGPNSNGLNSNAQNKSSSIKGGNTFNAAVRFGNSLANIFRDNFKKYVPDYDENEVDKKLRKEIEQVKNGENILM